VDEVVLRQVFFRALLSLMPILIPVTVPYSSAAGTIGPLVASVPSGLSLNQEKNDTAQKECIHDTVLRHVGIISIIFFYFSHGVRLSPLDTAATVWPILPAPDAR
jgi:hypothetical protein